MVRQSPGSSIAALTAGNAARLHRRSDRLHSIGDLPRLTYVTGARAKLQAFRPATMLTLSKFFGQIRAQLPRQRLVCEQPGHQEPQHVLTGDPRDAQLHGRL